MDWQWDAFQAAICVFPCSILSGKHGTAWSAPHGFTCGLIADGPWAGAQQFREHFEAAMAQNETLLALDDAEAASKDEAPTEVSDLADQVSKVSVAEPNGTASSASANADKGTKEDNAGTSGSAEPATATA